MINLAIASNLNEMRSCYAIKKEIEENQEILKSSSTQTDRQMSKAKDRLVFLRQILLYLETNPSEAYIKDQIDVITSKLELISERFNLWMRDQSGDPDNINNVKNLKDQLKTLQFIYNGNS